MSELSDSTGAPVEFPALVMDSDECPSSYTAVFSDSPPPYLSCTLLFIYTVTKQTSKFNIYPKIHNIRYNTNVPADLVARSLPLTVSPAKSRFDHRKDNEKIWILSCYWHQMYWPYLEIDWLSDDYFYQNKIKRYFENFSFHIP